MIIPFVGRPELAARENLAAFIEHAKSARFFKGPHALRWDDNSWDFKPFYAKVGQNPPGLTAHFTTWETTRRGSRAANAVDFSPPFLDAAKALTIEFLRTTGEKSPSRFITALRATEKAFRDLGMQPDACELTGVVLGKAEELVRQKFSDAWAQGRLLDRLANEFINPARVTASPVLWKTSVTYKRPARSDLVNKDGGAVGNTDKLPHLKAILDLSGIFHSSTAPHDVVITSWFALAMFAPERANEILSLPINPETEMDGVFGLSWRPLKGGSPKTNFAVTEEWGDVAREAIRRLVRLGEKCRRAAKWYEKHPTQLYLPPGLEHLRDEPITIWEASQILGRGKPLVQGSRPRNALVKCGTTRDISRGGNVGALFLNLYTFDSLQNYVLSALPSGWPYIDQRHKLPGSQGLFCLPSGILRAAADTEEYLPTFISYSQILHELGAKPHGKTIFARHGLVDPRNGEPWRMGTHQPRHLLNTLAQSKHVSQELIAFWSGRKSVRQNDKDCISCGENTLIKGNSEHLAEARDQLALHQRAFENAERAVREGRLGAAKWLERHKEKAERWAKAIELLCDPTISDGTLITLPPVAKPQTKNGLSAEIRAVEANRGAQAHEHMNGPELDLLDSLWAAEDSL